MSAINALPPVAAAPPPPSAQRADAAAGAADFAGLIGLAVANSAISAEIAAVDEPVDTETPAEGDESDAAAGATPPLLSWLFGVMAFTGATLPAAEGSTDTALADAKAPLPAAAPRPAADRPSPPLPGGLPATGAAVAAPIDPQSGMPPLAATPSDLARDEAADAGAPSPGPGAQTRIGAGVPASADAMSMAADTTDTAPIDMPLVDAQPQQPADASFAELSTTMPETGGADLLRELAQPPAAPAGETALLLSAPAAHFSRASTTAADAAAAFVPGGVLNPLSDDFVGDLGEHIEWQLADGIGEARIELHPAELGALTVRIETQGDQARVHIVAAEAATRSLLNQAMPQLRELLAGSGMNLARSQVDSSDRRDGRSGERSHAQTATAGIRRRVTQVLLVDAYA